MKKGMTLLLVLGLSLSLLACGQSAAESATIANPWTEVDSVKAAAEGAGVDDFILPEDGTTLEGGEIHFTAYRYMASLAEADGAAGAAELTVRKGVRAPDKEVEYDTEDVSGDYNTYAETWNVDANGITVNCAGNEAGQTMKAVWVTDDFSYCILVRGQGDIADTYGLSDADITRLVGAIA